MTQSPDAMQGSSEPEAEKRAAFGFYNGYLTVIYGLVVTDGLHYVLSFTNGAESNHHWNLFTAFLFLGCFLMSLHFWYVCATVDDLSQHFYGILAVRKGRFFDLLLLSDALVATAFAGIALAMFQATSQAGPRFFGLFLSAASLSLLYDFMSRFLVLYARGTYAHERERHVIHRYGQKIAAWIRADFVFLIGSAAMFFFDRKFDIRQSFAFGAVFALFNVVILLMDAEILAFGGNTS